MKNRCTGYEMEIDLALQGMPFVSTTANLASPRGRVKTARNSQSFVLGLLLPGCPDVVDYLPEISEYLIIGASEYQR